MSVVERLNTHYQHAKTKVDEDRIPFLKVGDEIIIYHNGLEGVSEINKIE